LRVVFADRLRVNVELTEAATGVHVWSETYDAELKDICRAGRHRATRRRCSRCEAHPVRAGADTYEADRKPRGSRIRAAQARVLVACKPRKERRGQPRFSSPRSLEINQSDVDGYYTRGNILVWAGRATVALPWLESALRFDHGHLLTANSLCWAYYFLGHYNQAVEAADRALSRGPGRSN
jgi:tetratricopeptide (TPR) repeat protein